MKETKAEGPLLPREHRDHGDVMALHSSGPCSDLSVSGDGKAGRQLGQSRCGVVVGVSGGEEVDRV